MEILKKFKEDGFFTSTLYHFIAKKKILPKDTEIIPSEYIKNLTMSTTERLQQLNGIDTENLVRTDAKQPKKPMLEFTPRIIIFQNFKPNDKIVTKFQVKNISNVPTFLNLVFKESSTFSIKTVGAELLSRLAPGIAVSFAITFTPELDKDYAHRVTFNTDTEEYVLPLIAMGPRLIISFPDEIVIPPTPLKVENSFLISVCNIGRLPGGFMFQSKCPFSVFPKNAYLHPNEKVEIKVSFKTMHLGKTVAKLRARFETDEHFSIKLIGTTYTVKIELEKAVVRFLDTYNTMVRQQVLKVTNKSDEVITYMCMKNDSIFNDFEEKIKLATIFYTMKDSELEKYRKLVHYDVLSSDEHERVYTRIFFDEIQMLVADESMYFHHLHFSMLPIKGKLWPKKTTELTITFEPKEIGDCHAIAYLDIDGILERIPLTLQGTSLPPSIYLNIETLDMDDVYINKTYRYEIVAINKGHINGVIQYRAVSPLFGSVITCNPEMHCLCPGSKEVFVISFLNSNQGPYFEELEFFIRDTDVVRKLYLKGEVIYPTVTFSIPCLDFGYVSVGVPKTLQVEVINESEVNVNANVKISSDGPEVSSITLEDCEASGSCHLSMPLWPREFNIEPCKIEMDASSRTSLKVTLTANLVRANQTVLELELDKSDSPPITLPISFNSMVPQITPAPNINLRACFIDFPYHYDLIFSADEYWGFFTIVEPEEEQTLKVDISIKRGMIKPNTTICLPATIMTSVLGKQEFVVRMNLFGSPQPIDICHIAGKGVRPIVTCAPMALHWGQIKLLTRSNKTLTLCNDSPVTVYFTVTLLYKDGRWRLDPSEGHIDPESETDIVASLCLIDADTYTNKAIIHLEKVKDIYIPLTAVGVGTSIIVGEEHDHINLGRRFTKVALEQTVVMKNCGTRLHNLEWCEYYKGPNKAKDLPAAFFDFQPRSIKMGAGEELLLKITGFTSKATIAKETWYLSGSVEGINKKELLMECEVTAEFVDPKIILSSTEVDLRYDYGPYSEFYHLTEILTITNVSKLPLDIDISIRPPFAIIHRAETYKIDPEDEDMCCCICYRESDLNMQKLIKEAGPYESQKFLDCITKKPIPRKRPGSLQFFQDINKMKMVFHLTHSVEERLEDQETMKIQILFDTTKHLTLRSKVYTDLMRIKFKSLKNKDVVKITGSINFPNVNISPKVDFQCILNGNIESRSILIKNPTGLLACYKFQWKKCNASRTKMLSEPTKIEYDLHKLSEEIITTSEEESIDKVEDLVLEDISLLPEQVDEEKGLEAGDAPLNTAHSISVIPKSNVSLVQDSVLELENMKKKFMKKIAPMIQIYDDDKFPWEYKFPKLQNTNQLYINDLFQLAPHQGLLKPGDSQHIHIIFRPQLNVNVRAVLECEVLGGPSEFVTVTGQSSPLLFTLNTQILNFKIRSFHENATEYLIIRNIANLPLEYKTYLNEPCFENDLPATINQIVPSEKGLDPDEQIDVAVMMRTGALGFFQRKFLLEIGHLPHIPIEVFGWGVIPQLYLVLPRPDMLKLHPELGYKAICTLTLDYLAAVSEIFIKGPTEHLNSPQMERCFEDPDFQEDWHLCSAWDEYPTIIDIDLAIERMLVVKHFTSRPEILTMYMTTQKQVPIPGFYATPYLVDYGVVITGTSISCAIDVINYGPIPIKAHFSKNYIARPWLVVKLCGKLNPGDSGKMEMTFAPTSHDFPESETHLDLTFNLEVPYGVTIPVRVTALCAVPFLKTNVNVVNLGSVRCGDKIIVSVPLKNIGKPTCIWYVTLKIKSPGPNALEILNNSGKYEPGEGGWISITFKPTMEMTYEAALLFRFHMNPGKLVVPVVGYGVCPHAHIIGPNLNFPPTLPWAETTENYFGITNPCPFPIELIIAHVDKKWNDEEEMFQLLHRYYSKPEELLAPIIMPGAGVPEEVQDFFDNFKRNVAKAIEEEAAPAKGASAKGAKSPASAKKYKPSPKKDAKGEKTDKKDGTQRKKRSEAEIISDEIKRMTMEGVDPLGDCCNAMDPSDDKDEDETLSKGLLLFLYGAPSEESNCQEMAYSLGMHLNIPTVNFDMCIVEALCVSECLAKTVIMDAINEIYENQKKSGASKHSSVKLDDECNEGFNEYDDEYDIILKKIEFISSNKTLGTPRSKASEKKKKEVLPGGGQLAQSQVIVGNAVTMFNEELLHELLADYFSQEKFYYGFVMDTLTSIVIKSPPVVLTTVLKCKHSIQNVNLILLHSDFTKWAQAYEEKLREAELAEELTNEIVVYSEEDIAQIIEEFEEMDADEYENANPELKAIYIEHGLQERRKKHIKLVKSGHVDDLSAKKEKSVKDTSTVQLLTRTDSKKKIPKKEDVKVKITPEFINMQSKFNEYKVSYETLINIACNWDHEEGDLRLPYVGLNEQPLVASQKKSKKKSEIQMVTPSEVDTTQRGFGLTLIMYPCIGYKEGLVNMFMESAFVQSIIKQEEIHDILKLPMNIKEYTVLLSKTMPVLQHEDSLQWLFLDEKPIRKCECNQITDLHLLDDTTQDNVIHILSKWHCTCGKRLASSKTSTSEIPVASATTHNFPEEEEVEYYPCPLPLRSVLPIVEPEERLILQPGDLVRCKYSYNPQEEGHFAIQRFVEVAGWPESRVDINITGICDIPRLDSRPKKLFANFVRKTVEDQVYKLTYLDDQKKFEFGPIFIGRNRIYEEEFTIDLKNASLLRTDVEIEFIEYTDIFVIDKNFISLEPGHRGQLTITAGPAIVGDHTTLLLFCIKDNPEIVKINISCTGVVPYVDVLPITKAIDYGKLLLYRREDDRFIVKNDSVLPIMWKVRNVEDFLEDFIISRTTGIVPRNDNHVVPVTYIACNVGVIWSLPLIIDIYDELGRGEPMLIDELHFTAECYNVEVECAYENPNESYLNYGNVKVNDTVSRDLFLLNRGKYNIYYKMKKVKNFPEPHLLKTFQAIPESGIIPSNLKLASVEFECTPTTSVNISNVPAYTCSLLDGSKDQVVVAKFPVCVTIASFYNTFTLFPLGELNFHIIPVGSGVMREVVLNNTSKCPFNYEIVVPEEYRVDPDLPVPKGTGKEKLKVPPLKCGNFIIMNEDNLLTPGGSRTIQIQFLATAPRQFEETIHFIVTDTCPAELKGVPLKLVGTGAMPTLDFWNLENTFREHLIVKNIDEYQVPETSPHCVFVEENVTLNFFCVTVKTSYCGSIDLYNNGLVPCLLKMKMHYQSNTTADIFYLDRYDMQIDPLLHKRLGIIFAPKELQEYRAVLDIKLKSLYNQEQSYRLCLIGEGVIPRICLIKPPIRQHGLALLRFPVTCLGSVSNKVVRFKNTSSIKCTVIMTILQAPEERPVFWMTPSEKCDHMVVVKTDTNEYLDLKLLLTPNNTATTQVCFNPLVKGRTNCDILIKILDNPYEYFTVMCDAEAFVEDVILIGLEMLSMDYDSESKIEGVGVSSTTTETRKKSKSAPIDKRKSKDAMKKQPLLGPNSEHIEPAILRYLLDFGGCEICSAQKRSVVMMNNSEKVYKFTWDEVENVVIKPSIGYISPGEEKDIEIMFFSAQPVVLIKETLSCNLVAINDETLTLDFRGATWDNRQIVTIFQRNQETCLNERKAVDLDVQSGKKIIEDIVGFINIVILYSVTTEYTKYTTTLDEQIKLADTYIYQQRNFEFKVQNVGTVPLKMTWDFVIDDEYPARIDRCKTKSSQLEAVPEDDTLKEKVDEKALYPENREEGSKETLFSGSIGRESVDTWFETALPFTIQPVKVCLKPDESQIFIVTFSPLDAFDFNVRLKSSIENLDPYDQNISCNIMAMSLIPHVHLDISESDYLSNRKKTGLVLPPHIQVLEFNVLGKGCFTKTFHVINPTSEGYEYVFQNVLPKNLECVPVHCNKLKGFVEGGTSDEVTFTFAPTAPGIYESQWKFVISAYNLEIPIMVAGIVREANVILVPTILIIKNSMVGFTATNVIKLKNNDDQALPFEYKGNSLCDDSGRTPVTVEPIQGILRPRSELSVMIYYTPIQDGPLSFKIFFKIMHILKPLTLCVNSLSHVIKSTVIYYIIGNEHILNCENVTKIHLEQTASTYERTIPFKIRNDGSAAFFYEWHYTVTPVKKYLVVSIEPKSGFLAPAAEVECILHFTLKTVPVEAYPVKLTISQGPEYIIYLYAEINKPAYHFSCKEFDFGMCIVHAPDTTYKKNLAFTNDETEEEMTLDLATPNRPELYVYNQHDPIVDPKQRVKIPIYFRPKEVKKYEFKLQYWVNSLCEEIITIRGEGVPLLIDLYEGCQKSFDLGAVKIGQKIIREIAVINHSKVTVDAQFIFKDVSQKPVEYNFDTSSLGTSICIDPSSSQVIDDGPSRVQNVKLYREEQEEEQIAKDVENALSSLKLTPPRCVIQAHRKIPLKIHFQPLGLISKLKVQLNVKVLEHIRPLVLLSGNATGMNIYFSQNSLQFGRVRKCGCKILKVMLINQGDFDADFWWQPIVAPEFTITPKKGNIAAKTNVTFAITFRPFNFNPYIKVWACLIIAKYTNLNLALYGACVDQGVPQAKALFIECPVRSVRTEYVVIVNPSDENWLVQSEVTGPDKASFEVAREFHIDNNSTFDVPIIFKPKTIGKHEGQVLLAPLGESALFVTITGSALHPDPNSRMTYTIEAKKPLTLSLTVYNIGAEPESYIMSTEIVKMVPDKFTGYYEVKHPDTVQVWGEATGTCQWIYTCYEPCEMLLTVMFVNAKTREYQFHEIIVHVSPALVVDTLTFECRARESTIRELIVKNPLMQESEFLVQCENLLLNKSIKIHKQSETRVTITYAPLVVGDLEDYLTIKNALVGTATYLVQVSCKPAKEKSLELSTPFGTRIPLRLRVQNRSNLLATFLPSVDHPSITTEKEYNIPPVEKGKFLVYFEPTELGEQHIRVSFNSSVAGEFVYLIKGIATDPKPQGPFAISPGSFTSIRFKNVFDTNRTFRIFVDREDFSVKKTLEPINAKKEIRVFVYLCERPQQGWAEPPTGCLTIETFEPSEPKVHWTYFLHGKL